MIGVMQKKEKLSLAFLNPTINVSGLIAGWSSPVARQAHNLKVVGSNPTPATNLRARKDASLKPLWALLFSGFRAAPCIYQGLRAAAPR